MAITNYPTGHKYWFDVQAKALVTNYRWLPLLSSYTPSPSTEVHVSDVTAHVPTDGSWTRQTVASGTVTLDLANEMTVIDCADPSFGSPTGGEVVGWLVFFANTGVDATSILMAAFPVSHTADGTAFAPSVNTSGLTRIKNP